MREKKESTIFEFLLYDVDMCVVLQNFCHHMLISERITPKSYFWRIFLINSRVCFMCVVIFILCSIRFIKLFIKFKNQKVSNQVSHACRSLSHARFSSLSHRIIVKKRAQMQDGPTTTISHRLHFVVHSLLFFFSFLDYYDSPWMHQAVHQWRTVGRNRRHNRLNSCFSSSWSGKKIQCVSLVMQFLFSVSSPLSFRDRHTHITERKENIYLDCL